MGKIKYLVIVCLSLFAAGTVEAASVVGQAKFSAYSASRQAEINSKVPAGTTQDYLPTQFDIYMLAGADYALYFTETDYTGGAIDITGYRYVAQYRNSPAPTGTLFATYSTAIINGPTGRLKMTLSKEQTTSLSGTSGVWDLLQIDPTGMLTYLSSGRVSVVPTVTEGP
jgi:hypothetical protein